MKKVLFNLTEAQYERLDNLARAMGVTRSEALRRAIEVYHFIKEAKNEGDEITRKDKDGNERVVEIIG